MSVYDVFYRQKFHDFSSIFRGLENSERNPGLSRMRGLRLAASLTFFRSFAKIDSTVIAHKQVYRAYYSEGY